jgi:hypothetical protein
MNDLILRRITMNAINRLAESTTRRDLLRMVEPLANYICATERPQAALLSAMAVLFNEVEATNQAAVAQFRTYMEN